MEMLNGLFFAVTMPDCAPPASGCYVTLILSVPVTGLMAALFSPALSLDLAPLMYPPPLQPFTLKSKQSFPTGPSVQL